jgi:hypothetical protein
MVLSKALQKWQPVKWSEILGHVEDAILKNAQAMKRLPST